MICIGNLTTGGTGKTPMVAEVVRRLSERGRRPAIVSRGWGGDEARLFADWLPRVPHRCDRDRVWAARVAVELDGADCIVLDDGFQHWRLERDLAVVLDDATDPFGGGHLLPRGYLREPPRALRRAGLVVLTRCDQAGEAARRRTLERIARWTDAPVAFARHREVEVVDLPGGAAAPPASLAGRRVHAFCGIGRPEAFRATLEGLGARVVAFDELPDHHTYAEGELDRLLLAGRVAGAERSITTEKDAVKLREQARADRSFSYLRVSLGIVSGESAFDEALDRALGRR